MAVCERPAPVATAPAPPAMHWSPLCCGQAMFQLMRRMLVLGNGKVLLSSVWNCGFCGRLMQ